MDAITTGSKHLNAAYTVINAVESHVVNDREFATRKRVHYVAPNTNFEKQTRFKIHKKQLVSSKKSLSTPSDQEKGQCIEKTNEIDIPVCGIEEDGSGNRLVQWIECDNCNQYLVSQVMHCRKYC